MIVIYTGGNKRTAAANSFGTRSSIIGPNMEIKS